MEVGLFSTKLFDEKSLAAAQDDAFARLLTCPNVIVTCHLAFFTDRALNEIARTALDNLSRFERGEPTRNGI
jgi:D-lactate dehydrogenase